MSRPPGLVAYLSIAALNAPAERRRIRREIAAGGAEAARQAERLGQAGQPRPEGPLIWLHASDPSQEAALCDTARRIGAAHSEAHFLLTSDAPLARATPLPARVLHQFVPLETSRTVLAFLTHWKPDLGFWAGTTLRPALIHEAVARGTMLWLIDASSAPVAQRGWRSFVGLVGATLRRFDRVLATDETARQALCDAGANAARVEITGPLEEETATLGCNMRERDSIAAILAARPVWLATSVPETEEDLVIAAHRAAARLAHRLLLIIEPASAASGPALAGRLAAQGLPVALRSIEGEPTASTEVLVADGEGDLGLWYRLAPVSYMGGTLDPGAGGGRSPLEPAALGSAILHGPHTGPNTGLYGKFWAAGAARGVADGAALGDALSELLSPDKAATMAHAAWRVSTGGADMSERVLDLVREALARRGAS